MILDTLNNFAKTVSLDTGVAATYNLGDVIDLGVNQRDIGSGEPRYVVIKIMTAVVGTSSTVAFKLVSDAIALPDLATSTEHHRTEAIAEATLVAGYEFVIPLPPQGSKPYERYLAIQQVTGVAALSAGVIDAFVTSHPSTLPDVSYPDAVN